MAKLIIGVGTVLMISLGIWGYFTVNSQKQHIIQDVMLEADRMATTIKLGTHYAMMHNLRNEITLIIGNIASEKNIEHIRIYNKKGEVVFSNIASELNQTTQIKGEACHVCHRSEPPLVNVNLQQRTRIYASPEGYRLLGLISPIRNEPGCSSVTCHAHAEGKKVLGVIDLVMSLHQIDQEIFSFKKRLVTFSLLVFLVTSTTISLIIMRFVRRPIKKMIHGMNHIANGEHIEKMDIGQTDELGRLSIVIDKMGKKIWEHQAELNRQRNEYQNLFEGVPCLITVQDCNYKLIRYNRRFQEKFKPKRGDFCYAAYKGRTDKCPVCPVEKTFEDGQSHFSEERGFDKSGHPTHWVVQTSPVKNSAGAVIAAMEMSLDVSRVKLLEKELRRSEKKYQGIFDNIPNPVFVLDMGTLEIQDCNDSITSVYGFTKDEICSRPFLDFFRTEERDRYAAMIRSAKVINQAKQLKKDGSLLYVNIRISPSEYMERKVFLVTTSDITQRLETEQQLIQASKMATLGEMATGVAHELNQPLSVIKTASRFFMKKIRNQEKIEDSILFTLAEEIDSYVDRATKIITHMRQFGRKSETATEMVQINDVLKNGFEILNQQLRVRGIKVEWRLAPDLPMIIADPNRLEQVFINLLINARDAMDEKQKEVQKEKKITLISRIEGPDIVVEIRDTGPGIPESIAERIFEPFFTTKKVGQGTGLGLSITYGIVKEYNGSIQALAGTDHGARFIVKFPIAKETDGKDHFAR